MGQDTETPPPDLGDEMPVAGLVLVNRRIEAYCKKYGKFRPRIHGAAHGLAHE